MGTYAGQTEDEYNGVVYVVPLRVVIADDGGELSVDTYLRDRRQPQSGETVLEAGDISWATMIWFDIVPVGDFYDSTSVTCAGGQVTAFAGPHDIYSGPPWGRYPAGTFELARTS